MKKRNIVLAGLTILLSACQNPGSKSEEQAGEERLVCISKQYTEIMYALGAEQNLVAVDISSTYPEQAKKLPTVGYHRALSLEAILAQKPTLILEDNNIGPEHVVEQLKGLKIPMKRFGKYQNTVSGADSLIREMGLYFHKEQAADSICRKLHEDVEKAKEKPAGFTEKLKVVVIHYGQASNIYLTMTDKSVAASMIAMAGGVIPITGEKGMQPISAEIISQSDPDVILLTDFGFDRMGALDKIKQLPGVANTRAARNNRIYRIEEHDLVYMGPRTGKNVMHIQELIHKK